MNNDKKPQFGINDPNLKMAKNPMIKETPSKTKKTVLKGPSTTRKSGRGR